MDHLAEGKKPRLQQLYDTLAADYELAQHHHTLNGVRFSFLAVRDSYVLLDRITNEAFIKDEQMPYWAEIWPSALVLSEYIATAQAIAGKRIIELGAGVGTVSVVAAAHGALVTATDYSDEALHFISYNALRNQVTLTAQHLDWRNVGGMGHYDLVLAADVLYERRNLLPVMTAIDTLLTPTGSACIADPRRRFARQFTELATENGFKVKAIERQAPAGSAPSGIIIYKLERQP